MANEIERHPVSAAKAAGIAWSVAGILGLLMSQLWLFIAMNLAGISRRRIYLGGFGRLCNGCL
jgi:hypothetical protein